MQQRHLNRLQYFEEQEYTTRNYVIPYISKVKLITQETTLLEIGCGEGGNIKPFLDIGCKCTGIDLSEKQIGNAKNFFRSHPQNNRLKLVCNNIYNEEQVNTYDIIVMRDVIEHIPNQEKFMHFLKNFLAPKGIIFFGFPPWQMPFGGHQQVLKSRFLSHMPYIHLLPRFCYKRLLQIFGEQDRTIQSRMEIKDTGISIERFEHILRKENYQINKRSYYFINPNYKIKFNLKPREQLALVTQIPWLRNFFTTAMFYVVSNREAQ